MTVTFRLVVVSIVLACVVAVVGSRSGVGHAAPLDIVLYAADVTRIAGNWTRMASTSGAAGFKMNSEDHGWSSGDAPLADPADFFEFEFDAEAGIDYRIWIRLRAAGDSKWNESVWVQFSGAAAPDGSPLWRIG